MECVVKENYGGWVCLLLQLPVWNLNFILISLITSNLVFSYTTAFLSNTCI